MRQKVRWAQHPGAHTQLPALRASFHHRKATRRAVGKISTLCSVELQGLEEMVWSHRGEQRGQTLGHSSHTLISTSHTHAYSYTPCNHDMHSVLFSEALPSV